MKNFLKTIGSNRRLAAGALSVSFKNPWNYLAELPAEARAEGEGEAEFPPKSNMRKFYLLASGGSMPVQN